MKKALRIFLVAVVLLAVLFPLSSSYAKTDEEERKPTDVGQAAIEKARDDTQFLLIEVTRKEDNLIQKADDTGSSASRDGTAQIQGYFNVSMAEYNATDLSGYTTEELVVFILNNHRSMTTMLYDHVTDPYASAKRYYHGLAELEKRADGLEVLQRALKVLEEAEPATDTERIIFDMRAEFIRLVLNSEVYQ